jgi:hypothetical protein
MMIVLYNSDSFAVMQVDLPDEDRPGSVPHPGRSGIEIVDKSSRKAVFLDGEVAREFRAGVEALVQEDDIDAEDIDAHLARYTGPAWQPVVLH